MIFVFGSNLAGRHGKGAAHTARLQYGAVTAQGSGPMGECYAIPTKDFSMKVLPLTTIKLYVDQFVRYAVDHPELSFNVTRVGCGLAGYTDEQVAPLFKGAPTNCILPEGWRT